MGEKTVQYLFVKRKFSTHAHIIEKIRAHDIDLDRSRSARKSTKKKMFARRIYGWTGGRANQWWVSKENGSR